MVPVFAAASACDTAAGEVGELALAARWRRAFRPLRQLVFRVEPGCAIQAASSKHSASGSNKNPAQDIIPGRDFLTLDRVAYFRLSIGT